MSINFHDNIKNIKMKPPVALFKKRIIKLYLFLKAKSQPKACCLHERKDIKKNVKNKIGESFYPQKLKILKATFPGSRCSYSTTMKGKCVFFN